MKICVDIGSPVHVHYFKNFIRIMRELGHDFLITARHDEQVLQLLRYYNFDFVDRGSNLPNISGKLVYMLKADYLLYRLAKEFNPDVFLSFASLYAAHASRLLGKRHVAFDDIRHSRLAPILYQPFADLICTPTCYDRDFGRKHLRFDGYMELCHLHPNYFRPDETILSDLNVLPDEKFAVVCFKKDALLNPEGRIRTLSELGRYGKVFISGDEIPAGFGDLKLPVPPHKMHDVLYFASLLMSESEVLSTEGALLGTPTVHCATLTRPLGQYKELRETYELLFYSGSNATALAWADELLANEAKSEWSYRQKRMLDEKVDVTKFMVEIVLNLQN